MTKWQRLSLAEPDVDESFAGQLAADLGVKIATLDPLESGPLSPSAYEEGMRRNAESIRKAFDAPLP